MTEAPAERPIPRDRAERLALLYETHARGALRLAYVLTQDRAQAEDVVQEAFVKLASRFHDLRHPDRFGGYLYRTVVNVVRGKARRAKVEDRYLDSAKYRPALAHEDEAPVERDELWSALLELPQRQRAVMFFRYYEDLSERETADVLDCSVSAVKSLTLRALRKLRERVEGEER